jgi:SRSO17 transposase
LIKRFLVCRAESDDDRLALIALGGVTKRGRPRQRHVPDILSIPAEDMLANAKWRTISWRNGTKGKLKARFAAVRVRVADGPPQRIRDKGQQHLPGDEAWLIGEHRMSGEKYSEEDDVV